MKTVAARDEVAAELLASAGMAEAERGRCPVEIVDAYVSGLDEPEQPGTITV